MAPRGSHFKKKTLPFGSSLGKEAKSRMRVFELTLGIAWPFIHALHPSPGTDLAPERLRVSELRLQSWFLVGSTSLMPQMARAGLLASFDVVSTSTGPYKHPAFLGASATAPSPWQDAGRSGAAPRKASPDLFQLNHPQVLEV